MTVKLVLLKSGEQLITDVKEGFLDERLVCYLLDKPCVVSVNGSYKILDDETGEGSSKVSISLQTWPSFSNQTTVEIVPDWIITIVDPTDELEKMYKEQVLGIKQNEINQSNLSNEQSDSHQSD